MNKFSRIVTIIIVLLAAGFLVGYFTTIKPQSDEKHKADALQQKMQSMVRDGVITAIMPTQVTVHLDQGTDAGQTKTYKATEYSGIQIGQYCLNEQSKICNLKKYFKKGDNVQLLVKGNQLVLLHREMRPKEKPPKILETQE